MEQIDNIIDIKCEHGHYVGYVNNAVWCTGDTYEEVAKEITYDLKIFGEAIYVQNLQTDLR